MFREKLKVPWVRGSRGVADGNVRHDADLKTVQVRVTTTLTTKMFEII